MDLHLQGNENWNSHKLSPGSAGAKCFFPLKAPDRERCRLARLRNTDLNHAAYAIEQIW